MTQKFVLYKWGAAQCFNETLIDANCWSAGYTGDVITMTSCIWSGQLPCRWYKEIRRSLGYANASVLCVEGGRGGHAWMGRVVVVVGGWTTLKLAANCLPHVNYWEQSTFVTNAFCVALVYRHLVCTWACAIYRRFGQLLNRSDRIIRPENVGRKSTPENRDKWRYVIRN
jgi:hypothetical protein